MLPGVLIPFIVYEYEFALPTPTLHVIMFHHSWKQSMLHFITYIQFFFFFFSCTPRCNWRKATIYKRPKHNQSRQVQVLKCFGKSGNSPSFSDPNSISPWKLRDGAGGTRESLPRTCISAVSKHKEARTLIVNPSQRVLRSSSLVRCFFFRLLLPPRSLSFGRKNFFSSFAFIWSPGVCFELEPRRHLKALECRTESAHLKLS